MQQQGMFGPHPLDLQDQLDSQFLKENSSLDLGSLSGRAGMMIGKGLNQMMGREDPRVAEAKAVQEAVQELRQSGASLNDPEEYYKKMAGIFGAKGLTKQAEQAAMKALEYKDKSEERAFKTKDRDMQLQIKSGELAIKQAQLQKEVAKASTKAGGPQLIQVLKDGFANAQLDQESISKALIEFNREGGTLGSALALLKNKEEKPEKENRADKVTANGRVYVRDPAAAAANPSKRHPTMQDYVDAGKAQETGTSVSFKVPGPDQQMAFDLTQIAKGKDEVKDVDKQIRALDNAYVLLNNRTPAAASMGVRVLAGAIQGGTLSKGDVAAVDNTGSLFDRLNNYVSKGITGTPSESVNKDLQLGIKVLRSKVAEDRKFTIDPYRKSATKAGRDQDELFPNAPKAPWEDVNLQGLSPKARAQIDELRRNK